MRALLLERRADGLVPIHSSSRCMVRRRASAVFSSSSSRLSFCFSHDE